MSAQDLERLRDAGAFDPILRFDELPIDHVPYQELVGVDAEGELRAAVVDEPRCVSVVAPSGAGKSSLIAAAAAKLPPSHPPLRISVGLGEIAAEPVSFGRHLITETRRLLDAQLEAYDRDQLDAGATTRKTTTKRAGGAKLELALPPIKGIGANVGGELRTSVIALEEDATVSAVLGGLDALVGVFAGHSLQPVLIFDDTDHWLGRSERGRDIAHAFFSGAVRTMAKDLNHVSAIIATHEEYTTVDGYRDARSLLTEIAVPRLEPPRQGLAQILGHRTKQAGVGAALEEVVDHEALVRLEAEYERLDRDLRSTLLITHTALSLAGPAYPERLGVEDIRAGVAELGK